MSVETIDNRSAVRQSVQSLLDLHDLSLRGAGDSTDAARACAETESPWFELSEPEQERINSLSADLYDLENHVDRRVQMSDVERKQWGEGAVAARNAFYSGDYDPTLKLFRGPIPLEMPEATVSFIRARCWDRLGEPGVALLFMKEAARLDSSFNPLVMHLLERIERHDEAAEYAEAILGSPESSPAAVFMASGAILEAVKRQDPQTAKSSIQRLIPVLRRALDREKTLPTNQREDPQTVQNLALALGLILEQINGGAVAIEVYNEGLAYSPDDAELLTARGLARREQDPTRALADFTRAVHGGAVSVWPYYFLAFSEIQSAKYLDCWRWCLQGLERTAPAQVRAQLHEWLGICRTMLGQPPELVLGTFDEAERLDPSSDRIRRHRAIAETILGGEVSDPDPSAWRVATRQPTNRLHDYPAIGNRIQLQIMSNRRSDRLTSLVKHG